jgi:hypothetical protein
VILNLLTINKKIYKFILQERINYISVFTTYCKKLSKLMRLKIQREFYKMEQRKMQEYLSIYLRKYAHVYIFIFNLNIL